MKEKVNVAVDTRKENQPENFYHVLDSLDLVMRNWVGDEMGTKGTDELCILCGIFALDQELEYYMPTSARAWLIELVNPKNSWKYHHEHGNVFGGQLKAYADLRQYLIDNAEKVANAYNLLINIRSVMRKGSEVELFKIKWFEYVAEKIESIAKTLYPDVPYWVDTGSRCNVLLAMLDSFERDLKSVRK